MNKILIFNLGSTSFKFGLFDFENLTEINREEYKINQTQNIQEEVDRLFRNVLREVGDITEIKAIGHRVVHGGDKYFEPVEITPEELQNISALNNLAPLHNPFNLAGINSAQKYLPGVPSFAVFDTAFFKDLPDYAKIYPIPYEYYEKNNIHKFGFHGISHKFVAMEACKKLKLDFQNSKLVTVHLGGGSSVTAMENGKPIDTSMGYTPLEGLMMQTRSGDIDPQIILELLNLTDMPFDQQIEKVKNILNKESGIKGITGYGNFLDILENVKAKDERAMLAFEMFTHRITKYIGAYLAALGSADAIVFTGRIGAGDPLTRKKITDKKDIFKNIKILTIEPNEELAIAQEIKELI